MFSDWFLSNVNNLFCYQGTTSALVASSSPSHWSLWPRKALHSVRGVYKSCWLTVCLVFCPPVLLRLHHRHQEHQHCHMATYCKLHYSATISCEPPLPALPWSISGTPTYAFWRPAVFRVFSDKPLTHIHSNTEHKRLLFLPQDLPPIPLFLLISVNLRPKRIALGSVLLTDCLFWSSLLKVFFISSKFKVCDLLHLI